MLNADCSAGRFWSFSTEMWAICLPNRAWCSLSYSSSTAKKLAVHCWSTLAPGKRSPKPMYAISERVHRPSTRSLVAAPCGSRLPGLVLRGTLVLVAVLPRK